MIRVTECQHQSPQGEVTEILIGLIDLPLHGIGEAEAKHQGDEVDLPSDEAHHHVVKDIAAKVPDVTVVDPGIVVTDRGPNLQVITEVIDTEVIPSHLKDQKRVTRRAEEEMNEGSTNCQIHISSGSQDLFVDKTLMLANGVFGINSKMLFARINFSYKSTMVNLLNFLE